MTILAALRRVWWLVPIAALVALVMHRDVQLADVRKTLSDERADRARADRDGRAQELGFATTAIAAMERSAARADAREPIFIHSRDTVTKYAATDAGRVVCRDAERVRAIDALDAELAASPAPGPAHEGTGAVPIDAAASPAGR